MRVNDLGPHYGLLEINDLEFKMRPVFITVNLSLTSWVQSGKILTSNVARVLDWKWLKKDGDSWEESNFDLQNVAHAFWGREFN